MNGYPGDDAVLTRAQCLNLLRNTLVGRVVYTRGALPAVTPVGYVLDGEYIVFRTTPGSRLDRAIRDAVVAFEIDHVEPRLPHGWSVVVVGRATGPDDRGAGTYIRISCQRITGRMLSRPELGDPAHEYGR